MSMLKKTNEILGLPLDKDDLFKKSDIELQLAYQTMLRSQAIDWIKTGNGVEVRGFRREYENAGSDFHNNQSLNNFLNIQSQNHEWGTYIEAIALAEKFGLNLMITSRTSAHVDASKPYCLYKAADPKAETIYLHNDATTKHWSAGNAGHQELKTKDTIRDTLGAGSCLYNAIILELSRIAKGKSIAQEEVQSQPTAVSHEASVAIEEANIIEETKKAEIHYEKIKKQALAKCPTPAESEQLHQAEATRMQALSSSERYQIEYDHKLALLIARDIDPRNANAMLRAQGFEPPKVALKGWNIPNTKAKNMKQMEIKNPTHSLKFP